jgi:predicted nucleic acid-binding protein
VKVVVDTSVWSLFLRRNGPASHVQVDKLTGLLQDEQEVAITGAILQEVLQAFRSEQTVAAMVQYLGPFPLLEADRETFIQASKIHRDCRALGIAASTIDCQIAAGALRHDHALLSADADFGHTARVCDLVLL